MKNRIKAALLSAFIIPGLGQLLLGRRIRGGIMIFLVNLLLLAGLAIVLPAAGKIAAAARFSGDGGLAETLERVRGNAPGLRWLTAAFFTLWGYGIVDALFGKDARE